MGFLKDLFKKLSKKESKVVEKLVVDKYLKPGMTKAKTYSEIVNTLVAKAKELETNEVILSAEFVPVLAFGVDRAEQTSISGEYLFGTKDGIKFIVSPDYNYGGRIENLEVELLKK